MDMTVLEYLKFVAALKLIDKSIKSAQLDQIIILDEPTVGLDPQQIIEIRQLIRGLAKDHTVILSSHILSEVREVCDHIMIIYQGKLAASDTPENLEQKMQGNETIELLVKGTPEQTRTAIRALPSLLSSQVEKSDEEGCTKALLTVKSHADIREDIFWTFSRNRLPLLRLANTRTTLEDIFLELTSDSAKGQAPAAGRRQGCEDKETTDEEDLTDESNL